MVGSDVQAPTGALSISRVSVGSRRSQLWTARQPQAGAGWSGRKAEANVAHYVGRATRRSTSFKQGDTDCRAYVCIR